MVCSYTACLGDTDARSRRYRFVVWLFFFLVQRLQTVCSNDHFQQQICVAAVDFDTAPQPQFASGSSHKGLFKGKSVNSDEG